MVGPLGFPSSLVMTSKKTAPREVDTAGRSDLDYAQTPGRGAHVLAPFASLSRALDYGGSPGKIHVVPVSDTIRSVY